MIGVRNTSRYRLPQLDLVSRNVDTQLTSQVRNYVTRYVPTSQLAVGSTTACCSGADKMLAGMLLSLSLLIGFCISHDQT